MVNERIKLLRDEMKKEGIDLYVIPTSDFHNSEYVGSHFKARAYMTGFTGSAGTAVISQTEAGLWTDGRYFVQAASQLQGTEVKLFKMGEENVPTIPEYLAEKLPEGGVLGFDGRVVSGNLGKLYRMIVTKKNGSLCVDKDLVDRVWTDRPPLSCQPAWILEEKYSGRSAGDKLADIRKSMEENNVDELLVSCLYDIGWILNIRGNDISYVPVVLSYLSIRRDDCLWFVQEKAIDEKVAAYLDRNHIAARPYDSFYDYIKTINTGSRIWMDSSVANFRICSSLPDGVKIMDAEIPSVLMRSIKNPVEVENTIRAHEKDACAMIEFMYWLKNNVGKIPMTELSVSEHLAGLRAKQEGFVDLSFETIAGYADHGAIVHYSATPESDKEIRPESFLLVDSGGHYLEGTTDITRTFALGPVSKEMKADFTRVLRSNLALGAARFKYGSTGIILDMLARQPFWEIDMDFNHGTGHGVGYLLNVHEGPQSIRWRSTGLDAPFEEGMITSNEPGMYLEGKYGIRIENEILCRKGVKNEYGQFMYFETITYVPVDLDAIDPEGLSEREKKLLNDYHQMIYEKMAPRLAPEIAAWLKEYTRPIA